MLRKLLLDGNRLVDQVNRVHRLKVLYRINSPTRYEETVLGLRPTYWSLEDGIDPDLGQPPGLQAPTEATRDQLLARRVMVIEGQEVSVRDLVVLSRLVGGLDGGLASERCVTPVMVVRVEESVKGPAALGV